uniref:Uncharacterized protein n=1 Tax=Macrostomum lignano TaxID=282301 RepID=A0A1I8FMU3_9PLAT
MELCDAGTLADELNRRRQFQEADTRCLLRQRSEAAKLPPKSPLLPEGSSHRRPDEFAAITALAEDDISASCPFERQADRLWLVHANCAASSTPWWTMSAPLSTKAPEIVNGSSYNYKCD